MTASLGDFALVLTLIASGWALVVGVLGAARRREVLTRSAEGALQAAAVTVTVASAALLYALFTKDFSIEYVEQYTSLSLSTFYTLGAFWAGQSGSLLLWAWLLSISGALVVAANRAKHRELMPWVTPIVGATLLFFAVLVAFYSNPFTKLPVTPPDGQGLNPLLQNYGQWVHPLALYVGFVGFTIPFAFAMAALITRTLDDSWLRTVRRWALWSWIFLTAGILFGARWAYVELGWGGYWAWDPVENASLMPWLAATAYLHSAVVQEKREMMKVWTVALATASFALCIFGTFLTRSGVISSVHAFAESTMGPLLIGFTVLAVVLATLLIVWRLPDLRARNRYGSVLSRESSFLATNLLLVGMTVVVLWGTIYPLVAEATRGTEVSVGPEFFEKLMAPLTILLLVVAGACPLLAWRSAETAHLKRSFKAPVLTGLATLAALLVASRGRQPVLVLVLALGAFVVATVVAEIRRGLHARRTVHGEHGWLAVRNLFGLTPRRYGGPIVHAGMAVLITGIAVNVAFKQEYEQTLSVGQSVKAGGYTVLFDDLIFDQNEERFSLIGTFIVTDADGNSSTIRSEQVAYENQQQVTEVGIDASPGADLYVVMSNADPGQRVATVLFFVEPGVLWIWVGMVIVVLGGVIAAGPRKANALVREPEVLVAADEVLPVLQVATVGAEIGRGG